MVAEIRLSYGETRCFYERGTVYVRYWSSVILTMLLPRNTAILRPYQALYDSITIVYDFIPLIYDGRYH